MYLLMTIIFFWGEGEVVEDDESFDPQNKWSVAVRTELKKKNKKAENR